MKKSVTDQEKIFVIHMASTKLYPTAFVNMRSKKGIRSWANGGKHELMIYESMLKKMFKILDIKLRCQCLPIKLTNT